MEGAVRALDADRLPLDSPLPVLNTIPTRHEKSYKTFITKQASDYWLHRLSWQLSSPPGRLRAYVDLHMWSLRPVPACSNQRTT